MFRMNTRWAWFIPIATAFWCNCASAQITPDATLPNNSIININGKTFNITGGTTAGTNLFHSFKDFSVPNGSEAFFNNSVDIQNIISRVTGGSISNIDGLIRTLGTANLFLINPQGIVFGPNASLNIGGSFIASTANSINFADGTKFSATPSQDLPLLTITAPLGLNMGSNPGPIQVRGPGYDFEFQDIKQQPRLPVNSSVPGLELKPGNTLALVGGNVSLEGGVLKSPAGRVEIGSVGSNGTVSLVPVQEGWKLGYSGTPSFGDIQFSGRSFLDTTGVGGGSIAVAGRNISLTGESILLAETCGDRNGGEISIVGDSISVISSEINTGTFSSGNAGQVKLVANKSILLENNGGAGTNTQGLGKSGEITLKADSIEVRDRSGLGSNTFGEGDAGRIEVKANSLLIENYAGFATSSKSKGDAGEMNIEVGDFVVRNYAGLGVQTEGAGNAGKINVTANSLRIEDYSEFTSVSQNTGNAGKISITANSLLIQDNSGLRSDTKNTGQAGEINVNVAGSVVFRNWAGINNTTSGTGNAGKINITANSLLIEDRSGFTTAAGENSTGQAGEINLNVAGPVVFRNFAGMDSNTSGTADGGQITVTAESLEISNVSGIGTTTRGSGNAGNLYVRVKTLFIDNGKLRVESTGTGNAGTLEIVADTIKLDNQINIDEPLIDARTTSGNGGNVTLNVANLLLLRRGSQISTTAGTAQQGGNGGNITINAPDGIIVAVPNENSDITANAFTGKGGQIEINTSGLFGIQPSFELTPNNDITAFSQSGISGEITINRADVEQRLESVELPTVVADTSNIIDTSCAAFGEGEGNSFTITGRGGLPPSPYEPLSSDVLWSDNRIPNITSQQRSEKPSTKPPTTDDAVKILPATGWVFDGKGNVTLISHASNANNLGSTPACQKK